MGPEGAAPRKKATGTANLVLLLSLYLILLAFFILLDSRATPNVPRSKAVIDSLSESFAPVVSPDAIDPNGEESGSSGDRRRDHRAMATYLKSALPLVEIDDVGAGRVMRVKVDSDALFKTGGVSVRPEALPVLRRMANVLAAQPRGFHHAADLFLAVPFDDPAPLASGRAAALLDEFAALDVPAGRVMAALRPSAGPASMLEVVFHVVDTQPVEMGPDP